MILGGEGREDSGVGSVTLGGHCEVSPRLQGEGFVHVVDPQHRVLSVTVECVLFTI